VPRRVVPGADSMLRFSRPPEVIGFLPKRQLVTLAQVVAWVLIITAVLASPRTTPAHGQPRPNVVLFITDDQHYELVNYMPIVQRELVARGVTFSNAYATTPLCCPSRASILTGQYAHNHGVWRNQGFHGGYRWLDASSTVAVWLQQAGVRTMLFGKYLNLYANERIPPGWDDWYAILDTGKKYYDYTLNRNGELRAYGDKERWYSTDVLTRYAVESLAADQGRPFFLYLAYDGPHAPPEPAKVDRGTFAGLPPHRPPSFNEEDVSDKPSWIRQLPPLDPAAVAELDEFRRSQVEVLQSIDRSIGTVIEALRADDRLADTWLIFMSDNGLSLGEHRFSMRKSCGYDDCTRVPLIIVPPADQATEFGAPRVEPGVVANIDLAPTLAELFGARPGASVDGRSLLPLLRDPQTSWQREIVLQLWSDTDQMSYRGLRRDQWKYLLYENGEEELYDMQADPYELDNLAGLPELAPLLRELEARLMAIDGD
jgi:N-acetylglucosamine-6-sulfatase